MTSRTKKGWDGMGRLKFDGVWSEPTQHQHHSMEKLKIPFYAVATEIQDGQEIVFGRRNTGQAVRASCSIPSVFRPVKIGDKVYVDGGVVSPVAVEAARRLGADVVIAVDMTAGAERTPPGNTIETLLQSIDIMYSKLAAIQLSRADVVIRPKVGHSGSADFSKRHDILDSFWRRIGVGLMLRGAKKTKEIKHMAKAISVLAILLTCLPSFGANIYQWIDRDGVPNFTDNYERIPFAFRDQVHLRVVEDALEKGLLPTLSAPPQKRQE